MKKKDIELLAEAAAIIVSEGGEALPSGDIGALAQTGVEELGEPEPEITEPPLEKHTYDIINKMVKGEVAKKLGFKQILQLNYTANGIVAVMEHEDGNAYKVYITTVDDPRILER